MAQAARSSGLGRTTTELSGARGRVLAAIRAAGEPVSIEGLAAQLSLHANTVRFHTSALEEAGLIEQSRHSSGGKGRPKAVFLPTRAGSRSGARNYQLLAAVLVDHLAQLSSEPLDMARAAGRSWGQSLAAGSRGEVKAPTAPGEVIDLLGEMGFEPQPVLTGRSAQIELHNCPFRELVDEHQQLVCAIHQGLLDGMLDPDGSGTADQSDSALTLQPFAGPGICAVHLGKQAT
ncbi:MAG TPA: helix-turn-helix domain-containing protein [Marmoricola sp.]|nr:helix-turn-helix domain-containing protein [Marmoricola sp.]HNI69967.1 helix-turn-helix domain-containing protein [Marmoricola sp.]HNJ78397.1 helix-turn-helix domain-containing protein [Marmoricola sp.]HNN47644.1 helix-turn-helix domain-containing protein [Marmoricola sp.]